MELIAIYENLISFDIYLSIYLSCQLTTQGVYYAQYSK